MTVRPGRNLVWLASLVPLLALLVSVRTAFLGLLGLAVLMLALAAAWDFLRTREAFSGLAIGREMPALIGRDLPFDVTLNLTNDAANLIRGELRDVTPVQGRLAIVFHEFSLAPLGHADFLERYRIPQRGEHHFGPVWVRVRGPWGLIDAQRAMPCFGHIRVLPETFASRDELLKDLGADVRLLDKIALTRQHGSGTEFESLHPYRYGDDPRRIDWRATARYRFPIVRRYQVERHRDVMILIDCGRLMGAETDRGSKLDCAVDAALNLARVALQSGDRCGVAMFDDRVRGFLPPVSGLASLRALTECVYDVQTQWRETDFTQMFSELQLRQAKRSLIVVFSDLSDVETTRQFRASLVRLGSRHLVLFAALRTPLLKRIVDQVADSLLDGARKAVTFRLLRDRQQSLHALRRSGVHVVDEEPQRLTLPLFNQFIELRQRNLL